MSELIEFREAKDSFIAKDPHSPLTKEQKREFGGWPELLRGAARPSP